MRHSTNKLLPDPRYWKFQESSRTVGVGTRLEDYLELLANSKKTRKT